MYKSYFRNIFIAISLIVPFAALSHGCAAGANAELDDSEASGGGNPTTSNAGGSEGMGGQGADAGMGGEGGMGAEGGMGGQGGMDPCAAGCQPGTWDLDDNPLTGECGCEYLCDKISDEDPIDPLYADDNCDGGDGLVEQCVYVSAALGMSNGAGTRQDPVDTIANGIIVADSNSVPAVCVSGEIYNEAVTMVSGISVYGGFDAVDANFAFRRSANVTTTVNAEGTVFLAPQIDQETHLAGLTINATTPANSGESTYGVRLVSGSNTLYVRYNIITVGDGVAGIDGTNGSAQTNTQAPSGSSGGNGCEYGGGLACNSCNAPSIGLADTSCAEPGGDGGTSGSAGNYGGNGDPGNGGSAGGTGASPNNSCTLYFADPGTSGTPGTPGVPGSAGTAGTSGTAVGTIASGAYQPAAGGDGTASTNGKGGGGGGGGGGGSGSGACCPDRGGAGGGGGCGGLGGNFGSGGGGGGASIGVFVAAGTAVVTDNTIQTGSGGDGGDGGDGAIGQTGGAGEAGGGYSDESGSGGAGGLGGTGGLGAPGGGGGGGPSACVVQSALATVSFAFGGIHPCTVGLGGTGGTGGIFPSPGGNGNDGTNGQTSPIIQGS